MAERASTAAGRRRASARGASSTPKPAAKPKPRSRAKLKPKSGAKSKPKASSKPKGSADASRPAAAKPRSAAAPKAAAKPAAKPKRRPAARAAHGERGIAAALGARRARRAGRRAAPAPSAAAPSRPRRGLPGSARSRLFVAVLLVASLGAGYSFWLRDSSLVAIDTVEVEGLQSPDAEAITARLAESAQTMTTLRVERSELEAAVEDFPTVAAIDYDTALPDSITIDVTERPPAMLAKVEGSSHETPVAADGTLLPGASTDDLELPVMELADPPEGDELRDAALEQALVVGAAPKPLRPLIERIEFSTGEGVTVGLAGGVELEFGESERAAAKWRAAAAVMADPELTQLAGIDLRVPSRPAVS